MSLKLAPIRAELVTDHGNTRARLYTVAPPREELTLNGLLTDLNATLSVTHTLTRVMRIPVIDETHRPASERLNVTITGNTADDLRTIGTMALKLTCN
jgi:hypothetical protein